MIMWFAENLGVSNEKRCKDITRNYPKDRDDDTDDDDTMEKEKPT